MTNQALILEAAIGTGTIAIVIAAWQYVKMVFSYVSSILIVTNRVEAANLSHTLLQYLVTRSRRRWHLGGKVFASFTSFVTPLQRSTRIAVKETSSSTNLFLFGFVPIMAVGGDEDDGYKPVNFSFIRGTVNWSKLLKDAIAMEDEENDKGKESTSHGSRYRIYKMAGGRGSFGEKEAPDAEVSGNGGRPQRRAGIELLHWSWEDLGTPEPPCALDKMSLRAEQIDFLDEVRFWRGLENWCKEKGVPWHRGYMFHGDPGTGKTSLARAMAEDLDMPVYAMDLASMTNADLQRSWSKAIKGAPCIVLIEDIDAVFHGRVNQCGEDGVSFDCLLNCIDGIESTFGVMTIITTNHLEKVDPALACLPSHKGPRKTLAEGGAEDEDIPSRPGRVDRLVHFDVLDEEGREKMARRILEDEVDIQKVLLAGANDAAAQFQERCFRRAMARRFKDYYDARKAQGKNA